MGKDITICQPAGILYIISKRKKKKKRINTKIILHKTRRTRPPNPVKAAVGTVDGSAVLISGAKTTVWKVNEKEMETKNIQTERHLLTTSNMWGFVNNIGLLDSVLLISREIFASKADEKERKNNKFHLAAFYLDTVLFIWIMALSPLFLCFGMSCATGFSVNSSNKNTKKQKHWMSVQCWRRFEFQNIYFHSHPDMLLCWCARNGLGEWRARSPGGCTHTWQVCATHGVTWRRRGRLGPKQMKLCLMAAFIKFTKNIYVCVCVCVYANTVSS